MIRIKFFITGTLQCDVDAYCEGLLSESEITHPEISWVILCFEMSQSAEREAGEKALNEDNRGLERAIDEVVRDRWPSRADQILLAFSLCLQVGGRACFFTL